MKQSPKSSKVTGQRPDGTNTKKSNGNRMNPGGQNVGKPNNEDPHKPTPNPNLKIDNSGLVSGKKKKN